MLAGEITNVRNATYTRYTYTYFNDICAYLCQERGNSIQDLGQVYGFLSLCRPYCVWTSVFIVGEVADLKITFLGFDEFIYSGINSCTGKHCAGTEKCTAQGSRMSRR